MNSEEVLNVTKPTQQAESIGVTASADVTSVHDDGRTKTHKCFFCDNRLSLLVLQHLRMLFLFMMMAGLELASALPGLPTF